MGRVRGLPPRKSRPPYKSAITLILSPNWGSPSRSASCFPSGPPRHRRNRLGQIHQLCLHPLRGRGDDCRHPSIPQGPDLQRHRSPHLRQCQQRQGHPVPHRARHLRHPHLPAPDADLRGRRNAKLQLPAHRQTLFRRPLDHPLQPQLLGAIAPPAAPHPRARPEGSSLSLARPRQAELLGYATYFEREPKRLSRTK